MTANAEGAVRGEIERRYGETWSRFDLLEVRWPNGAPPGDAVLGPLEGGESVTANGSVLFTVEVDSGREGPIRLPLAATVRPWMRVAVTRREVPRGESLQDGAWREEERPLAELRGATPLFPRAGARLRARRNLRAGEVLTTGCLEESAAVASGARVTIRYVSGTVRLTAAGIARRSGRIGETIPVENADSRRTLLARVVGEGTVEVSR